MSKLNKKLDKALLDPRTDREKKLSDRALIVGGLIATLGITAASIFNDIVLEGDESRNPPSIERVVEMDAETLDEQGIEKGQIVYNDTEDTYYVYVDDTEVSPAQEPGWYEVDMKDVVIPDQEG